MSLLLRYKLLSSGQQARPDPEKKAPCASAVPSELSQRVGEMPFEGVSLEIPHIFWPLSLGIEMQIQVTLCRDLPVSPLHSKGRPQQRAERIWCLLSHLHDLRSHLGCRV